MATTSATKMRENQQTAGLSAHAVLAQHLTNVTTVTAKAIQAAIAEYEAVLQQLMKMNADQQETNGTTQPVVSSPGHENEELKTQPVPVEVQSIDAVVLLNSISSALANVTSGIDNIQKQLHTLVSSIQSGRVTIR